VGKSYLIQEALSEFEHDNQPCLLLRVDGSTQQLRGDFMGLLETHLAPRSLSEPFPAGIDWFPKVRKVSIAHRAVLEAATKELEGAPDGVKQGALLLLKAGLVFNQTMVNSKKIVDMGVVASDPELVELSVDKLWSKVRGLSTLTQRITMPRLLSDMLGVSLRNRVRHDLFHLVAEMWVEDLKQLIFPRATFDPNLPAKKRGPFAPFVLLIVDDYEALAPLLEDFLIEALIPKLAAAPFRSLVWLSGRDDLEAMHPSWSQHLLPYFRKQLRLEPFAKADALLLLEQAGVPEEKRMEIYEQTQGYPFLLHLLAEEVAREDQGSALMLRKFYDRTTRWMSERQREWFIRICYLDNVNHDSLACFFSSEDVPTIQDWFEQEASIRDPAKSTFCVRPLIRQKVLKYQEIRSPNLHREWTRIASEGPCIVESETTTPNETPLPEPLAETVDEARKAESDPDVEGNPEGNSELS
jgi:hypothetical protein